MLFIEAPKQMQERISIPKDHYEVCSSAGVQTIGNAAANVKDFLDLSGQNMQPGWIPDGFTTRGVVALVFSALSAVIGIASLVIYGMADLKRV
jgi:iron transport multicopper oxidase